MWVYPSDEVWKAICLDEGFGRPTTNTDTSWKQLALKLSRFICDETWTRGTLRRYRQLGHAQQHRDVADFGLFVDDSGRHRPWIRRDAEQEGFDPRC